MITIADHCDESRQPSGQCSARIFQEAFGFRQVAAGGFGAVLMNGVKRGLFSNEAGSGSAPCAAAAAECDQPVKAGLVQALGVFIDTIVICSCTAMIMLLAPEEKVAGLSGMDLLQTAMRTSSRKIWCGFYCGDIIFVQLLDIPWNFILCKKQCGISFRR